MDCFGATDPNEGTRVTAAFESGALWKVRSLIRNEDPDDSAILIGRGWWLSSDVHRLRGQGQRPIQR
jgi:hypothetical protein